MIILKNVLTIFIRQQMEGFVLFSICSFSQLQKSNLTKTNEQKKKNVFRLLLFLTKRSRVNPKMLKYSIFKFSNLTFKKLKCVLSSQVSLTYLQKCQINLELKRFLFNQTSFSLNIAKKFQSWKMFI